MQAKPPKPRERNEQMPLGPHASYEDVLDTAVDYTFPCSDPIAVDSCCANLSRGEGDKRSREGPG